VDVIAAIRIIRMHNRCVEKFLLNQKWFDDTQNEKLDLINKYEKITFALKKVFPKSDTKLILGDVCKKYFGLNDNEKIMKALGVYVDHNALVDDEEVDTFLSNEHRFF
jgi:hypothetical protein